MPCQLWRDTPRALHVTATIHLGHEKHSWQCAQLRRQALYDMQVQVHMAKAGSFAQFELASKLSKEAYTHACTHVHACEHTRTLTHAHARAHTHTACWPHSWHCLHRQGARRCVHPGRTGH